MKRLANGILGAVVLMLVSAPGAPAQTGAPRATGREASGD